MFARLRKDVAVKLSFILSIVLLIIFYIMKKTNYQMYSVPSTQVLYNHMPRCGGRSVSAILRLLAQKNNFQVLNLGAHEVMVPSKQREFISWFTNMLPDRIVVAKNTHFIDFTNYEIMNPAYINVVRDPLERSISYFYWKKGIGCGPGGCTKAEEWKNVNYDDCVRRKYDQCTLADEGGFFKIIPYFCGQEQMCKFPSKMSLLKAKYNVDRFFKVVGILEDLSGFFEVLEKLMPDMFTGVRKIYNETGDKYFMQFKSKDIPRPEIKTVQLMKTYLQYDYDFYYWVKARFYSTLWSTRNGTLY